MKYGTILNPSKHALVIKCTQPHFESKGYRLVPNHTYSNFQPQKQLITPWIKGKRFHICLIDKVWYLHQDKQRGDEHLTYLTNKDIKREINRLKI